MNRTRAKRSPSTSLTPMRVTETQPKAHKAHANLALAALMVHARPQISLRRTLGADPWGHAAWTALIELPGRESFVHFACALLPPCALAVLRSDIVTLRERGQLADLRVEVYEAALRSIDNFVAEWDECPGPDDAIFAATLFADEEELEAELQGLAVMTADAIDGIDPLDPWGDRIKQAEMDAICDRAWGIEAQP